MTDTMVEVRGRKVALIEGGRGEPLVYLHGFADVHGVAGEFQPFHLRLGTAARVIAPAHPGCAQSDELSDGYGIDDVIFHYLEVFDALGLGSFDLVGHCVGGWIAAELAVRYPERVRRLGLIGACGLFVPGAPIGDVFMHSQPERGVQLTTLRRLLFAHESAPAGLRFFASARGDVEEEMRRYQMLRFGSFVGFKPPYFYNRVLRGRLYRAAMPAAVIWGAMDRMVPCAHGDAYVAGLPGAADLTLIPGAGHAAPLEQADATADALIEFLGATSDGASVSAMAERSAAMGRRRVASLDRTLAIALLLLAEQAAAQPAEQFFARKTVTITIGYTAGGSYDLYGRMVARHLGKHIAGQPTLIAQNMPGAGSLKAANYLYEVAPKDGTALGVVVESAALEQALANPAVQYDAAKFTYVGRVATSNNIFMQWHTAKVQSLDDAKRAETSLAGTGPGSIAETVPRLLNALIGTRFKLISGYPASSEAMLAMERGEVEGASSSWAAVKVGKAGVAARAQDQDHPADHARAHRRAAGRAEPGRDRRHPRGQAGVRALCQRQRDRTLGDRAARAPRRPRQGAARRVPSDGQGPGIRRRAAAHQRRA